MKKLVAEFAGSALDNNRTSDDLRCISQRPIDFHEWTPLSFVDEKRSA